jgi:hypothetical protein
MAGHCIEEEIKKAANCCPFKKAFDYMVLFLFGQLFR